jgi:hypothetical protein
MVLIDNAEKGDRLRAFPVPTRGKSAGIWSPVFFDEFLLKVVVMRASRRIMRLLDQVIGLNYQP